MELKLKKINFKYLILFLYLVFILTPGFSKTITTTKPEDKAPKNFFTSIDYSVGTGLSYLNGQYREIVYPPSSSESQYYSELLWDLENLIILDLELSAAKGPWNVDLSLGTAITKGTGVMTDTDWLDTSTSTWTHWSLSDVFIHSSFLMDLSVLYNFETHNNFNFPTGIGYKLNYWDWEEETHQLIYKYDADTDTYYTPWYTADLGGSNGIDYMIIQHIFYISTAVEKTIQNLKYGIEFSISPLSYTWDKDHHYNTNLYYIDTFLSFASWGKIEFNVEVEIDKKNSIVFNTAFETHLETSGNTYYYNEDSSDREEVGSYLGSYSEGAGMASYYFTVGFLYMYKF